MTAIETLVGHLQELGAACTWAGHRLEGMRLEALEPDWDLLKKTLAACELAWARLKEGEPEAATEALGGLIW